MGWKLASSGSQRVWYVRDADNGRTPSSPRGPFTRDEMIVMFSEGKLSSGELVLTHEKIFPNPSKPNSSRKVIITEWRRWDQLPDPVRRELEAAAARYVATLCSEAEADEEIAGTGTMRPSRSTIISIPGSSHPNTYPAF